MSATHTKIVIKEKEDNNVKKNPTKTEDTRNRSVGDPDNRVIKHTQNQTKSNQKPLIFNIFQGLKDKIKEFQQIGIFNKQSVSYINKTIITENKNCIDGFSSIFYTS